MGSVRGGVMARGRLGGAAFATRGGGGGGLAAAGAGASALAAGGVMTMVRVMNLFSSGNCSGPTPVGISSSTTRCAASTPSVNNASIRRAWCDPSAGEEAASVWRGGPGIRAT